MSFQIWRVFPCQNIQKLRLVVDTPASAHSNYEESVHSSGLVFIFWMWFKPLTLVESQELKRRKTPYLAVKIQSNVVLPLKDKIVWDWPCWFSDFFKTDRASFSCFTPRPTCFVSFLRCGNGEASILVATPGRYRALTQAGAKKHCCLLFWFLKAFGKKNTQKSDWNQKMMCLFFFGGGGGNLDELKQKYWILFRHDNFL